MSVHVAHPIWIVDRSISQNSSKRRATMAKSALSPPNSQWECGDVLERARPSSHNFADQNASICYDTPQDASDSGRTESQGQLVATASWPTRRLASDVGFAIPATYVSDLQPSAKAITEIPSHTNLITPQKSSSTKILQTHRERRRLTQIRYRKKLNNGATILERDAQLLREEIQKLELQLRTIALHSIAKTTSWNMVGEYFRLSLRLDVWTPLAEHSRNIRLVQELSVRQEFLHDTMFIARSSIITLVRSIKRPTSARRNL